MIEISWTKNHFQIVRMRQLLDHVIQVSKRQEEDRLANELLKTNQTVDTVAISSGLDDDNYYSDAGKTQMKTQKKCNIATLHLLNGF